MTIGGLLREAGARLREAGIRGERHEARLLLAHVLETTCEALLLDSDGAVVPEVATRLRALLARRCAREPMAYLTGQAGFWTLDLEVSIDTLIPRADSESVVRLALRLCPAPTRVLDLGAGTGCLLLAVLAERPEAWGVGIDLRPGAASLASRNARRNGMGARTAFAAGSWGDALRGNFDLILSNPPYIRSGDVAALMPEVAQHEPASALDGGWDGMTAFRALGAAIPCLLAPGGVVVLEVGTEQAAAVRAIIEASGLVFSAQEADLGGIPRALAFRAIGAGGRLP